MKCVNCGKELHAGAKFCTACGTPVAQEPVAAPVVEPVIPPVVEPIVPPVVEAPPVVETPPVRPVTPPVAPPPYVAPPAPVLPRENRPLGAWAYFGLQLLFSIPLIGFICLIVFSLDDGNINRRNFARSYWCALIVSLVLIIALVVLAFTVIGIDNIVYAIEEIAYLF